MTRARREFLEKAFPSGFHDNNDGDDEMIGVTPIEPLFGNIKLDDKGHGHESTLIRRYHNCSEGDDLNAKNNKSAFG